MKQTQFLKLLALGLLLSGAIGCQSTKYGVTPLGDRKPSGGGAAPSIESADPLPATLNPGTVPSEMIAQNERGTHEGWAEDSDLFKPYTVHFDYDSSVLNASEKTKLEAIANQLRANPAVALKIEGHCDERGTEEYNRSLGERRALALREELVRLGIDPTRVETISYGDGRPVSMEPSETGWKQNRRGEFVALTPPK